MRTWLKGSLLVLFIFCASWAVAVWYWRATNRMPSTSDLATYMIVLPLSLLLAVWVGRRLARIPAPAAAATAVPAIDATPAPVPPPSVSLLASAVRTAHGASPLELNEAIGAQSARADLDPELLDDSGYPVMSVRADNAIDSALRTDIAAWLSTSAFADPAWTDEQWRSLALGSAVTGDLVLHALGHPHAVLPEGTPVLRIHACVTSGWSEAQRTAAAAWLADLAAQAGWPASRVHAHVASDGPSATASASLSLLAGHAGAGGEPVLAIVLAFGSLIGEAGIEQLARSGTLFSAANPQGLIPGEGAAGVLVADAAQAALFGDPAPSIQIATAYRDSAAASGGKPDPGLLRQLSASLIPDAASLESVKAVFADTSHRTNAVTEVMAFASSALPHLDAGTDLKATGVACGHCGDVPFVAALALAHQHVSDTATPALCVGHDTPLQRTAALVRPVAATS